MADSIHELLETLQPSLSVLQNPTSIDRNAKRLAIGNLRDCGIGKLKDPQIACGFLQNTYAILLNCICQDRVEKCREQCLEFAYDIFSYSSDTSFALPAALELCKKRVLIAPKAREPEEDAEEIRLGIVRLLNLLLSKCSAEAIKPAIADDIVQVVQGCIKDKFPDVQKEACCVLLTITERKSTYIGYFGDKITKAVTPILRHKHAILRTLGIQVVERLVVTSYVGLKPLVEVTEDYDKSIMEALSYDNSPAVREALARCNTAWLTTCSPIDRYKFADVLLPLLLTAAVDDIPAVRQSGEKGLKNVGLACVKDMQDAGILTDTNYVNETASAGLTNLIHHTFKGSLQSISHVLCIPFNQQRALSLNALQLLLKFSLQEDMILQLTLIISTLATVQELETHSKGILNQLTDAIVIISKKISKSSFYLDILIPQISNTVESDTRMKPSTCLWLLERFINYAAIDAISLHELSRILDLLKSSTLTKILLSEGQCTSNAANILHYAILHCIETTKGTLGEDYRNKTIMVALHLMALCSMSSDDKANGSPQDEIAVTDSINTKQNLLKTVMMLHNVSEKPEDVFVQYLPCFLEAIKKPRANPPEKWDDESVFLRMLEVILMESGQKIIESRQTLDEVVRILIRCGSQKPDGKSGRDTDGSVIGARSRCLAIMTWLYNIDKDTLYLQEKSGAIIKDMVLLSIVSSEPQNGSCALNIQFKLRQQAVICLTTALETGNIARDGDQQGIIPSIIVKGLQDEDEQTRVLSVSAMAAYIKQYERLDEKLNPQLEQDCLQNILSRFKDQKKAVYLSLYSQLPTIFSTVSNQGRQMIIDDVVAQMEYVNESSDMQLKVAFKNTLDVLYRLEPTRIMGAIEDAQQASTKPNTYQQYIDTLLTVTKS